MRLSLLLLFFNFLQCSLSSAQPVEVITKSDFKSSGVKKNFSFIEPATDTSHLSFVAAIKITGAFKNSDIANLYLKLKTSAQNMGANCFRVKSFHREENLEEATLTLDVFYAEYAQLLNNYTHHEGNIVYIFGSRKTGVTTNSCRINGVKKPFEQGMYLKEKIPEGGEIKINKSIAGAALTIKWEKGKQPYFFSLTGFDVMPGSSNDLTIKTGGLDKIDSDLGHLMAAILTPVE